jgi:hypothetical protein
MDYERVCARLHIDFEVALESWFEKQETGHRMCRFGDSKAGVEFVKDILSVSCEEYPLGSCSRSNSIARLPCVSCLFFGAERQRQWFPMEAP